MTRVADLAIRRATVEPTFTPLPTPKHLPLPTVTWHTSQSPDGRWEARWGASDGLATDDPDSEFWYYRATVLVANGGENTHTVLSEWSNDGLGRDEPAFLGWSPDSTAAFVYDTMHADGCDLYEHASNIDRVDLATGKRTRLVDDATSPSLSPDGLLLALLDGDWAIGHSVLFVDAVTGHRRLESDHFALLPAAERGYGGASGMSWSADSRSVTIDLIDGECGYGGSPYVATARVNAQTGQVTVAEEAHPPPTWTPEPTRTPTVK